MFMALYTHPAQLTERRAGNKAYQAQQYPQALAAYQRALAIVEFVQVRGVACDGGQMACEGRGMCDRGQLGSRARRRPTSTQSLVSTKRECAAGVVRSCGRYGDTRAHPAPTPHLPAPLPFTQASNRDDQEEVERNRASTLLNIAAVHMAQQEWGAAVGRCTAALALQPDDPKALLRRAKANVGRHEYAAAQADLSQLQQVSATGVPPSGSYQQKGQPVGVSQ